MKQAETQKKWKVKLFEWGSFVLDGGAMFGIVPKPLWSKLITPDADNGIRLALRSMYLELGDKKVLVDLGMGNDWDEKFKKIYKLETGSPEQILKEKIGVVPSDITHIILSHMHFDHCGFICSGGKSNFPNAEIIVLNENWKTAHNPNAREAGSYIPKIWQGAATQFRRVDCEWLELREVLPGIRMRRVDGHTPGQAVVYIEGTDSPYIFLGDLASTEHHLKEAYVLGYDLHAALSVKEKSLILREDETLKSKVIFSHSVLTQCGNVQILDNGQIALTKS